MTTLKPCKSTEANTMPCHFPRYYCCIVLRLPIKPTIYRPHQSQQPLHTLLTSRKYSIKQELHTYNIVDLLLFLHNLQLFYCPNYSKTLILTLPVSSILSLLHNFRLLDSPKYSKKIFLTFPMSTILSLLSPS